MKLKIEVYECLCSLRVFEINDIKAEYWDFGDQYDHEECNSEDYWCGNMMFVSKPVTESVLIKYDITEKEYFDTCCELEEKLSFGCCGLCIL